MIPRKRKRGEQLCYCWAQFLPLECYWPVCLLESSAVLAPCLLDGNSPYGASDSQPPPITHTHTHTFSPQKSSPTPPLSLCLSLSDMRVCWEQTKFTTQLALIKTRQTEESRGLRDKVFFCLGRFSCLLSQLVSIFRQKMSVEEIWGAAASHMVAITNLFVISRKVEQLKFTTFFF